MSPPSLPRTAFLAAQVCADPLLPALGHPGRRRRGLSLWRCFFYSPLGLKPSPHCFASEACVHNGGTNRPVLARFRARPYAVGLPTQCPAPGSSAASPWPFKESTLPVFAASQP